MYRSRTWSCIASRTAAAKRARRVLFPRTSQSFFSFRTSAGSFLLASLFFCGKRKGRFRIHGPCSPVARTVLPAVFFEYKQRVYPGYHVENRVSPHSDAGSRKKNLTSKLAGILWIPHQVRDDSAGPPGDWGGHKKRAGRLSSSDFLPAHLFKVAATYSPTCAVPSA